MSLVLGGCTAKTSNTTEASNQDKEVSQEDKNKEGQEEKNIVEENQKITEEEAEKIMLEYNDLLTKGKPYEVLGFVDENIQKLSEEKAGEMIVGLGKVQKQYVAEYTDSLFEDDYAKQNRLHEIFGYEFNKDKIDTIEDEELKAFIVEILKGGYEMASLEGDFYPMIDYGYLKKYIPYLSDDMKDYIEITSKESNELSFRDGAIAVSWNELADRALKTEMYLTKYKDGAMRKEIDELYIMYVRPYIHPMYNFETHKLDEEYINTYKKVAADNKGTVIAEITKEYLEIIEKNDYKENDDVMKESDRLYQKALEKFNLEDEFANYNAQ